MSLRRNDVIMPCFLQVRDSGLDREVKDTYTFTAFAVNGEAETASVTIEVTLDDVNNKDPVFESAADQIDIDEDEAPGSGRLFRSISDVHCCLRYDL